PERTHDIREPAGSPAPPAARDDMVRIPRRRRACGTGVPHRKEMTVTVMRRLVVNADDLGLTVGVNDGVFDAHDHGILTSASLFAGAPATSDAIRRARGRPSLGVGVHLALVDGTPTLPPRRVPTLVAHHAR